MNSKVLIEAFGYLGSTLVVVSMLMNSVIRLRLINTVGSVISATYALIIGSYPLALMNICLIVINVYHLLRLRNTEKHYSLVEGSVSDGYVQYLMRYYGEDIQKFFPGFSMEKLDAGSKLFTVCCDREVAGVLIGKTAGSELDVDLDYSTPVYRDCSVGTYLYSKLPEYGIRALKCTAGTADHDDYLTKMGFAKTGKGTFYKKLR